MNIPVEVAHLILEFALPQSQWCHLATHRRYNRVLQSLPCRTASDFPRIVITGPNPIFRTTKFMYFVQNKLIIEYMPFETNNGTLLNEMYDLTLLQSQGAQTDPSATS